MPSVFVYEVSDRDADSWTAELAVLAETPQDALKKLRAAGLHKNQLTGKPAYALDRQDVGDLLDAPGGIVRRRLQDSGWSQWQAVSTGGLLLER